MVDTREQGEAKQKEEFYSLHKWFKSKTTNVNVMKLSHLNLPINLGNEHWLAACVDIKNRKVSIYDSLSRESRDRKAKKNEMKTVVFESYCEATKQTFRGSEWRDHLPVVQQQTDFSSCGIFTCWFLKELSTNDRQTAFNKEVINPAEYRCFIAQELVQAHQTSMDVDPKTPVQQFAAAAHTPPTPQQQPPAKRIRRDASSHR
ncbi:cysteine proteinase [Auricularia subglabra TFB-10046 SS5]|nr:cysteine proteinase [Auricularia subglabra TFB-10046 SS5]